MTVVLPSGWRTFQGGAIDAALCDQGALALIVGNLSCADSILTTTVEIIGGAPPFNLTANGGRLTVTGLRTATLSIDTDIPVGNGRCGGVGTFAYSVKGSVRGTVDAVTCCDVAISVCVTNFYNCYGQWIGFTAITHEGNEETCTEDEYPAIGGFHRFQSCNVGCGNPYIVTCDHSTEPCLTNYNELCAYPVLIPSGMDQVVTICDDFTFMDLQLPPWNLVTGCYPWRSLTGLTYKNFGEDLGFFDNNGITDVGAMLAAHLHLRPQDGVTEVNGDTLEGVNLLFTGGCYPCTLAQDTDITVQVTDALGNSTAAESHIS